MEESEKRYVVYVKGEFKSVHYNSRNKILQVDGYYKNDQNPSTDTTFTTKLLSAKTWKRKKDAENRLNAITSTRFNKQKNLTGEVIPVTITITI